MQVVSIQSKGMSIINYLVHPPLLMLKLILLYRGNPVISRIIFNNLQICPSGLVNFGIQNDQDI